MALPAEAPMLAKLLLLASLFQVACGFNASTARDGITIFDAGSLQTPPVPGAADCCQPLTHALPTSHIQLVAGLRYTVKLTSVAGNLGSNTSSVLLKLVRNSTQSLAQCADGSDIFMQRSRSQRRRSSIAPDKATVNENVWEAVHFPQAGSFLFCYVQEPSAWQLMENASITVHGSSQVSQHFHCAAELGAPCRIPVHSPEPSARISLVKPEESCGSGVLLAMQPVLGQARSSIPRDQLTSGAAVPVLQHLLGYYRLPHGAAATFRVCLCNTFSWNVSEGPACQSSSALDFTQSLGLLSLTVVSTAPDVVYSGQPFELQVSCGGQGCVSSPGARIRLLDMPADGQWPEAACTQASPAQSALHRSPENCQPAADKLDCHLAPVANSSAQPAWRGLLVRAGITHDVVVPARLGVCYCSGIVTCEQPSDWVRVGAMQVNALRLLPETFHAGLDFDMSLHGPGGEWTSTTSELKVFSDPFVTSYKDVCTSGLAPVVFNKRCIASSTCLSDRVNVSAGPVWTLTEFSSVGSYVFCYCNGNCGSPRHWTFVSRALVAGPRHFYVGAPGQSNQVSAGVRTEVAFLGVGLSPNDYLSFLPHPIACGTTASSAGLTSSSSQGALITVGEKTPHLLSGSIVTIVARTDEFSGVERVIGLRMVTLEPHGLSAGQVIAFENVTTKPGNKYCPILHAQAWGREMSHCSEVLMSRSGVNVTAIESERAIHLDLILSANECNSLDLTGAKWRVTSHETFLEIMAARSLEGRFTVCWGSPSVDGSAQAVAQAGVLEVSRPGHFRAALHLTSTIPGNIAPSWSILAFVLGNHERYAPSQTSGPTGFKLGFRNASRFRHAFHPAEALAAPSVAWRQARQGVCGQLFQELWSDAEEGFPHPRGCFYDGKFAEYGLVFEPHAGLHAGARYQIVMQTEVLESLVQDHEWLVDDFAIPEPSFSPEETRHMTPFTWGEVGSVVSEVACKEACASITRCNVAVYRASIDRSCTLADISARQSPYATTSTRVAAGQSVADMTMFLVDRLNRSSRVLDLRPEALSTEEAAVVDVWSLTDLEQRPSLVLEASSALVSGAGLPPAAPDPRFHPKDGLLLLGADEGKPLRLESTAPQLRMRLRAATASRIEAGATLRIFMRPFTQWAFGKECLASCTSGQSDLRCGRVSCTPESLVTSPWAASRNSLRIVLPPDMDAITDKVMHTLTFNGSKLRLPEDGFLPTRLAAEIRSAHDVQSNFQPHTDYTLSTGALVYAPVRILGTLVTGEGASHPFAGDTGTLLMARLRFGSAVHSGPHGQAHLALRLPVGYQCQAAHVVPGSPDALLGSGQFLEAEVEWSFATNVCSLRLKPNVVVYGGSRVLLAVQVDRPAAPLSVEASRGSIVLQAPGEGDEAVNAAAGTSAVPLPSLPALPVLGRLELCSITPTDASWRAPRNLARVFFRRPLSPGGPARRVRIEAPAGFSFHQGCLALDLASSYYRPPQALLAPQATVPLSRLPTRRRCQAWSPGEMPLLGVGTADMAVAELALGEPLEVGVLYGFAIQVLHTSDYKPGSQGFALSTFLSETDDGGSAIDRASPIPLLLATKDDAWPSYGLYALGTEEGHLRILVSNLLPFAHTSSRSQVILLLQPPLDFNSTDPLVSVKVSWRVLAPESYVWDYSQADFLYRAIDVQHGATADLPISEIPLPPFAAPFNLLSFIGKNEHSSGWRSGKVYGFRAAVRVPVDTPRHAVNEWIAEWGYDRPLLADRACFMRAEADEVRTIHSAYVRNVAGGIGGSNDQLLFQFATVTEIPVSPGALVIEAPEGFVFESACVPLQPALPFPPYLPVESRLDCAASGEAASAFSLGTLRPIIVLRPVGQSIRAGLWTFLIACVNPVFSLHPQDSSATFLLRSYESFTDDMNSEGTNRVADVGAELASFRVREELLFASIVNPVDRALAGRSDHPRRSSHVVIAFELRRGSLLVSASDQDLRVLAPVEFEFLDPCHLDIGDKIFGIGQPFPNPCVPFEEGVRVLSCVGTNNEANARLTPGLLPGKRYAFAVRVDLQPAATPSQNDWRMAVGLEASLPMAGYRIWAFEAMELAMLRSSRSNEAAPVENHVDLIFAPTNTVPAGGMLLLTAPQGYRIHARCSAKVVRLSDNTESQLTCRGEQPPTNKVQIRFHTDLHVAEPGRIKFKLSLVVSSPTFIAPYAGYWTLQSYLVAAVDPEAAGLLDIGRVSSVPVTEYFRAFAVNISFVMSSATSDEVATSSRRAQALPDRHQFVNNSALSLPLDFEVFLPRPLTAGDVLDVVGPPGYQFAIPVADISLREDLRRCSRFEYLDFPPSDVTAGPQAIARVARQVLGNLLLPLCADRLLRLQLSEDSLKAAEASKIQHIRFRSTTEWPRQSLDPLESAFKASLAHKAGESLVVEATSLAFLAPITPRLLGFQLSRIGPPADAVSTMGNVRISFNASQAADVVSVTSRVGGDTLPGGSNFMQAAIVIHAGQQLVKDVLVIHDRPDHIFLLFSMAADLRYVLFIRGVVNPDSVGPVLWTLQTYSLPGGRSGSVSTSKTGVHKLSLSKARKRDEMVDWFAMQTVGRVDITEDRTVLENSFFDFPQTRGSFTFSMRPIGATAGQRLLIFAPPGWQFTAASFQAGEGFPLYRDLGPLSCFDTVSERRVLAYVVRLLGGIRSTAPCKLNPAEECVNYVSFSLLVGTPSTPPDLERWRRESDQTWLVQVDTFLEDGCGPSQTEAATAAAQEGRGSALEPALVRLTNDALFKGFYLRESIAQVAIIPEPSGRLSRQWTTVAVEFQTKSWLVTANAEQERNGIFLRLLAPSGVVFDRGCLAAVPDPDFSVCEGAGSLAILRIHGSAFARGQHRILLRVTNPAVTPTHNKWLLESFVGLTFQDVRAGYLANVRQRGQAEGFEIEQSLTAALRPSSTDRASTVLLFLWMKPSIYVEELGFIEFHAPLTFEVSCEPAVWLMAAPPLRCRKLSSNFIELQIIQGGFLLPNTDLEIGVHGKTPPEAKHQQLQQYIDYLSAAEDYADGSGSSAWGVRLRGAHREVLESNMAIPAFQLTGMGLSVTSLTPSTRLPYARNEIRLLLNFARTVSWVSDLEIHAPAGWDLQPLCSRFWDATGACGVRCEWQLPYSEERGHHRCPQPSTLLLLLDPARSIRSGVYSLLYAAMNPASAPPVKNLWRVSLRSPPRSLGEQGLLLSEAAARGFTISRDSGNIRPPLLPLHGQYLEIISPNLAHELTAALPFLLAVAVAAFAV